MKKKILVCDDDIDICDLLYLVLTDEFTEVICVTDSLTLFSEMEQHKPDLLILDLWMPILSGDQILRQIRKIPKYIHFPVIVISASREGELNALEAGANTYVPKPFNIDDLGEIVDSFLLKNDVQIYP